MPGQGERQKFGQEESSGLQHHLASVQMRKGALQYKATRLKHSLHRGDDYKVNNLGGGSKEKGCL